MKSILVIDDDRLIRQTFKTHLSSEGFEVHVAADGLEGVREDVIGETIKEIGCRFGGSDEGFDFAAEGRIIRTGQVEIGGSGLGVEVDDGVEEDLDLPVTVGKRAVHRIHLHGA